MLLNECLLRSDRQNGERVCDYQQSIVIESKYVLFVFDVGVQVVITKKGVVA
jgi:hypothetical protein